MSDTPGSPRLYSELAGYLHERESEFDLIPPERQGQLVELADWVAEQSARAGVAKLVFICTHNSRRSHMAQLFAWAASTACSVQGVETYSGGTEATAVAPPTLAALSRAGFSIRALDGGPNPKQEVRIAEGLPTVKAFSKVYDHESNPSDEFCAVMTCAEADADCPVVIGASYRSSLSYEDPKLFDGTANESKAYDERCAQIARELMFSFSRLR